MKTRKYLPIKWSSHRFRVLEKRLRTRYGSPRHHNPEDPLDDLIFLMLSRMTQEVKYLRTYRALRERMPVWGDVRDAHLTELEDLLRDGGLAATKSRQIQALLKEVEIREGDFDLAVLHHMPDDEVEEYLVSLPGVSKKTAKCVMLYTLGRPTCPIDAHVWRVAQRLGIAQPGAWTESRSGTLEARFPIDLRASLHRTLVAHGRVICRARRPICKECCVSDLCPRVGIR